MGKINNLTDVFCKHGLARDCPECVLTICGRDIHGAESLIMWHPSLDGKLSGVFTHVSSGGKPSRPRVEMFPDGLRLGCSFVTSEAFEKLADEWKSFKVSRSKVIQE